MLSITKDKDVKAFVSFFDRINQQFKNRIKSKDDPRQSEYTISQGKIYSFNEKLLSYVISSIVYQKKEEFFREEFNLLTLLVNGTNYYAFMQTNRKFVNEILMSEESGLTFKTSIPEVEFNIPLLKETPDIKLYKQMKKEGMLQYVVPAKEFDSIELNDDIVMDILNSNGPYVILIDEIKIRLTHKVLFGINVKTKSKTVNGEKISTKITSKVNISLFETNSDDIFVARVIIDNKDMTSPMKIINYFAIINY